MSWGGMQLLSRRIARALGWERPRDSLLPRSRRSSTPEGAGAPSNPRPPSLLGAAGRTWSRWSTEAFPCFTRTPRGARPTQIHSRWIIPHLFVTSQELPPFPQHIPLFPKPPLN